MSGSLRLAGIVTLALVLGISTISAAAKSSADMVKVEASAGKIDADGKQEVTLTLNVEEGWHLYANPVGNEDLTSAQTTVKITGKTVPKDVKIDYPKGKVVEDKTVGNYSTYEGKVVIKAKVSRAKDDTGPLDVTIKLQACNERTCLPPGSVKVKVE
ncbi:MAG TPA: protein-disulfide reductase DsbD N-terminal domain-containing protein [Gemmataceae bacterium]|jgi:DsbC/DsbD-like thiol-disulfide interchange protein|nr:protein-disulfide reductase DsbD N-terminal domain-containing protein [Gemmataceae bacterium]